MIDYYDIEVRFLKQGQNVWLKLPGHNKTTAPVNRQKVTLSHPHWMSRQFALICSDHLRLQVCPAKVLGQWNTWGTPDLRLAVLQTAPPVLEAMGFTVTPETLNHLRAGNYRVREVHVAHQFWLHDREIADFVLNLYRSYNESHYPQLLDKGTCFYINARSRRVSYVFYAKDVEFWNKGWPRYQQRILEKTGSPFLSVARDMQSVLASTGPRLEIRFGDQFFRNHRLAAGSAWGPDTACDLYREHLQKLGMPPRVRATYMKDLARALSGPTFRSYLLWAAGYPLSDLGSLKTVQRHCQEVRKVLALDIRLPASAVLSGRRTVDAATVFNWGNRVIASTVDIEKWSVPMALTQVKFVKPAQSL